MHATFSVEKLEPGSHARGMKGSRTDIMLSTTWFRAQAISMTIMCLISNSRVAPTGVPKPPEAFLDRVHPTTQMKAAWRQTPVYRYSKELHTENKSQSFNTTFSFPYQGGVKEAPVLLFLNGASCESWEYSDYLDHFTAAGFVTVVTDLWRKVGPDFPSRPEGCPKDRIVWVSSDILKPILSFIASIQTHAQSPEETALSVALHQADTSSLVLLAHSFGGTVAADLLEGSHAESQVTKDLVNIKGAIIFEGGSNRGKLQVDAPKFVAYLTSTITEPRIKPFYDHTEGTKDWVVVGDCNHFAINNFHSDQEFMVSPCAVTAAQDPATAHFRTTESRQREVIATVAEIALLEIKGRALGDEASQKALKNLQSSYKLIQRTSISPFT